MPDTTPKAPRRRRWLRAAAVIGGLLVLYTALGFLAAPSLVRRVAVKQASAALHRPVEIDRVRVNPLALSVTVEGLRVKHADGAPFAAWDALYVRLAPLRLLAGDLGFAEIRLVRPALHVGLDARGALTFEDLLAGEPDAGTAGAAAAPAKEGGLGLSIGRLAVEEARVVFRDATRKPAFETTLGPLTVRLESFRTRGGGDSPYSFAGTTESGETFRWTGTVRSAPLRSSGTLAFERIQLPKYAAYIHDQAPVDVAEGALDLETTYELAWGADARVLRTSGGKLTVERLALAPRGEKDAPVRLPRVEVAGIQVDALAKEAAVATVTVRGGAVRARLEQDGKLELARMAPPPSPPSPEPWRWSVGALAVSGLAVDVEDRSTARPVRLPLTDVAVALEGLRPGPETACPLTASLAWNGRGRLTVKGAVRPFGDRGTLALEAEELDLVPLAPYLDASLVARLAGGRAGAKATIGYELGGKAPRWTFAGDVRLDGLAVTEAGNEDLLRWRALEVTGIDAASTPPRATVRRVRLLEPRVKAYVWEDGATSVARALRPAPAAPAPAGPAWQTAIGSVEVVGGRVAMVDRSVTPAAVVNLTGAQATVTRLSSDPKVRSSVDVRLQVEGASPVRVTGTLNPLQKEAYTELVVASEGVDLSPLGPYAGKFLGYGLQKGKLDLDLKYTVVNRALTSTNVVRVNQLTLGDKTDSPDATKVPVRLALALLQDRDGVILLDVPVEGNLDDPEFRLGKVIWRTILNVLVKVATSPFTALASLVGGDQADLSLVEFTPGTAEPLPAAKERIALLARSLAQRPALGLELEGSADAAQDGPALRHAALERALRRAKAETLRTAPASLGEVTLGAEERVRLVKAAYQAAFPAPPPATKGEAAPAPTPQEMEERLAAAAQVPDDAYRALAAERAQRAREALVAAGLDQARLFLAQGGERARKEGGARVYFSVR